MTFNENKDNLGSGDMSVEQLFACSLRRLSPSDSQYFRRLVTLKQQVDAIPEAERCSQTKAIVYNALMKDVYNPNEVTRILKRPSDLPPEGSPVIVKPSNAVKDAEHIGINKLEIK